MLLFYLRKTGHFVTDRDKMKRKSDRSSQTCHGLFSAGLPGQTAPRQLRFEYRPRGYLVKDRSSYATLYHTRNGRVNSFHERVVSKVQSDCVFVFFHFFENAFVRRVNLLIDIRIVRFALSTCEVEIFDFIGLPNITRFLHPTHTAGE